MAAPAAYARLVVGVMGTFVQSTPPATTTPEGADAAPKRIV